MKEFTFESKESTPVNPIFIHGTSVGLREAMTVRGPQHLEGGMSEETHLHAKESEVEAYPRWKATRWSRASVRRHGAPHTWFQVPKR